MKKTMCRGTLFIFVLSFSLLMGNAQITVNINSGNPRYPFPQFLEYAYKDSHRLGNLGTKNAEGVVHAEMEQDIRDAYQIMMNRAEYVGGNIGGVRLIHFISNPDCSEGDGYALLAAAYMADKNTFDGLWLWVHENRMHSGINTIKRSYVTGTPLPSRVSYCPGWTGGSDADCAADADFDIGLALLVAYMQWGENSGITTATGELNYKEEARLFIEALVKPELNNVNSNYFVGNIGTDGYVKGGNTWQELTNWGNTNGPIRPESSGPRAQFIDYCAPSYFRQFREFLTNENSDSWNINQFHRGEASSDWLMGKMLDGSASAIPFVGEVSINNDGITPIYNNTGVQAEDIRASWRTVLNYVWHGNPAYSWDPTTHQVVNGGNSYELDVATRYARFLNNPQATPWNNPCKTFGGGPGISYKGPLTLSWDYTKEGKENSSFTLNWIQGCGIFSAIAAQDFDLMGLMYRQCNIEWDAAGGTDNYLGSVPVYFHGWYRLLGMLGASGNYHSPSEMKPIANMKIYRAIKDSVTFAFTGDELTYLLDYRNYGSVDASQVKIVEKVPADFVFVSTANGGQYDAGTHTVTWNIGTVPGFKTGALPATKGQVSYTVRIADNASGRYCTTAEITCSNGKGWTSNEYPNYVTATMQRNCVDVVARSLKIEKTVNRTMVNSGNMATYTINFENSSDAGWIDGGRPRVNVAYAHSGLENPESASQLWLKVRLYNDAIEPYINYGNYRISYYMYDAGLNCYAGTDDCPVGWGMSNAIYEGGDKDGVKISHENIVEGTDANGKWNQRLIVQFAPLLVTTTAQLSNYFKMDARIHKGGTEPMRGAWYMYPSDWSNVNYADDWSWNPTASDADDGRYYPVSPSWQDINNPEIPVTSWIPCACETANKVIENILVEEYDGYVWRRILGNGPMPGRDVDNVVVRDTLPKGLTFGEFLNNCPLEDLGATRKTQKTTDGRDIIIWSIPKMQVKQKGSIIFTVTADFPSGKSCETADESIINYAWISGDKNSPASDTAKITVTCAKVPEPIVPTTLVKTADKESYKIGDPITYTIEYEQTHGSIVKNAATTPGDWRLNQWNLAGGNLTSGSTQTGTAMFDYARGRNGYLEFECNPAVYAAFQVLLRDGSGSTIALVVKPLTTSQMELTCYVGGTVRQTTQTIVYGGGNPFTMRIDLNEDLLRVWVNKDTTNAPIYSVNGLPVGIGYAGFKNGNTAGGDAHGAHSFSKIYTHFDYAYNLSIIDRKPAEITFASADNSGTLQGDSIVWNFVSDKNNPIPFGKKYTVTWKGTISACDEFIVNIAYVKLMGHANNEIMAQAISKCGESEPVCKLTSASLDIDALSICAGDSTLLSASTVPTGSYLYEYFLDGVSLSAAGTANTLTVKTAGEYHVVVYDKTDLTCLVTSDTVTLTVQPLPKADLGADLSACAGETITLDAGLTADFYLWSDASAGRTLQVDQAGEYRVTVTMGGCSASDTINVSFGSAALSADGFELDGKTVSNHTDSICAGTTAQLITTHITDPGTYYTWSAVPADSRMIADGNTVSIAPKQTTTYYVRLTQKCEAVDSVTIRISEPMTVEVKSDTLCGSVKLTATAAAANPAFLWQTSDSPQTFNGAALTIDNTFPEQGSVTLTATAASACPSEPMEISYQLPKLEAEIKGSPSVCPGGSTLLEAITATNEENPSLSYQWHKDGSLLPTETNQTINAVPGVYRVTVASAYCTEEAEHQVTEGSGELAGSLTVNDQELISSPHIYKSCGEELVLTADYATTGTDGFTWSANPADPTLSANNTNTINVQPLVDTEYYLQFENGCLAYDTIRVRMKPQATLTVDVANTCGKTTMTAGTTIANPVYTWFIDNVEQTTTTYQLEITPTATAQASVTAFVHSDEYCISEPVEMEITVDTLSVTVIAPSSVCKDGEAALTSEIKTSVTETPQYQWSEREAGTNLAFQPIINGTAAQHTVPQQTQSTQYRLTVTAGSCTVSRDTTVSILSPTGTGTVTADAQTVGILNGVKTYKTCGTEAVALNATHVSTDENGFTWSSVPEDLSMSQTSGRQITVNPTENTTYIVRYENQCALSDTIKIELKPQATLTTDVTNTCGKTTLTANTTIANPVYTWFIDDVEQSATTGQIEVTPTATARASIKTLVRSDEYCISEPVLTEITVDTLSVIIAAPASVCQDGEAALTSEIKTSVTGTPQYQWYEREAGTILAFQPIINGTAAQHTISQQTQSTQYRLTVTAGSCTVSRDTTVSILNPAGTGAITANAQNADVIDGIKTYKTCGTEAVALNATHVSTDENGFTWSSVPEDLSMSQTSGRQITVNPTENTTYIVRYENQCALSDTLKIELKPQATLTVDVAKACGTTTLTAGTTIANPVFTWFVDDVEQAETNGRIEITPTATARASVKTLVRSDEYCISEPVLNEITVDTLSVTVIAPSSVCKDGEVALTSEIKTSVTETPQYQWSEREAGTNTAFRPLTDGTSDRLTVPQQTQSMQYQLTVTAGSCIVNGETTVSILNPAGTGAITANAQNADVIDGVKTYKTCGTEAVVLNATHVSTNENGFTWSSVPEDLSMSQTSGRQITVNPTENTTYIVRYENQCLFSDTLKIERHSLEAAADWSQFAATECEGKSMTAGLTLTGYDPDAEGSYIRWYKDGVELTQNQGNTALTIEKTTVADIGNYSYAVSNGVCRIPQGQPQNTQRLEVVPYTSFSVPQEKYTIIKGDDARLEVQNVQPSGATVSWSSGTTTLNANPAIIGNVTQDRTWTVEVSAPDYCPSQARVELTADAKATIEITAGDNKICYGTDVTLTADTAGTGKILRPEQYTLTWQQQQAGGGFTPIPQSAAVLTFTPESTATYRAEVKYGSQTAVSSPVTVEVYPQAVYRLTENPVVCSGSEITVGIYDLQPSDASITWDDDLSIVSSDPHSDRITVSPQEGAGRDYHFTVEQQGLCSQRGVITVGIQHPVNYTLSNDTLLCKGEKTELAVDAPQNTLIQWRQEPGEDILGTENKLTVRPEKTAVYAVTMSAGVCPPVTETTEVQVSSPAITKIEQLKVREVEILADPSSGTPPFLYKIDGGEYSSQNTLTVDFYGKHTFTLADAYGCKDSRDYVLPTPEINPPTIFSPDGDGINDVWEVPGLSEAYPDAVITIYDRFGKKLVELSADSPGWDGSYNGSKMSSTDYWYEIDVPEIDKTYVGHFTLMRK